MTLRRLFPQTSPAKDFKTARQRSLSLYREWLREIPRAIQKYPLEISIGEGRCRVRKEFEKSAQLLDKAEEGRLERWNVAILKGTQDLIEVHNKWMQRTHIMRWFEGAGEKDSCLKLAERRQSEIGFMNLNSIENRKISNFLRDFLTK